MYDKPKVSFVMPGIRPQNWVNVFTSLINAIGNNSFELIIVSPYLLPQELEQYKNIKLVRDFGSPTRCFNIGLEMVEGEILIDVTDDGLFRPTLLSQCITIFENTIKQEPKFILGMVAHESARIYSYNECHINIHAGISSHNIDDSYVFLPTSMIKTEYMRSLGGLDSVFQGTAMAFVDFSIRAQQDAAKIIFTNEVILDITHMPGTTGDHAPIHYAQTEEDEPAFRTKYNSPDYIPIIKIPINNWKNAPSVWARRFK